MTTRSKAGITRPNPRYLLSCEAIPKEPKSVKTALRHSGWKQAMEVELQALIDQKTFQLVPKSPTMHVLGTKWVWKTKLKSDGSLDKLKARYVAKGFNQVAGLDFQETFSPVIKHSTVHLVLSLATMNGWSLRQLDVKNAFLHGPLDEPVYVSQQPGFVNPLYPDHVWKLNKALYGLKQAPRTWFNRLSSYLVSYGFFCSTADPSLFVYRVSNVTMLLLLYVDDIILTGNDQATLHAFIHQIGLEFAIKDMGLLHFFLGIEVHYTSSGLFLTQSKYAREVLQCATMDACNAIATPMQTSRSFDDDIAFSDPHLYRSIASALQYLTITRPDLTYCVNHLC